MALSPLPLLLLLLAAPAPPAGRAPPRPPAPAVSPAAELARGRVAFSRGEYARAIEILRPLLYPEPRLNSEGEIANAHRMLGVAHLYERQNEEAAEEFRKLLQLRPDYRMDRLLDPPMVVDFFNALLREQEAELADLDRMRRQAEEEERRRLELGRGPSIIERHYARNSLAVSFLPFGAGQFQNGQRGKGWFFLASQATLAGVSVGALGANFAIYGVRPRLRCEPGTEGATEDPDCPVGYKPSQDRARSRLLMRVQQVSGALFLATYIWGVTDAILNFRPVVPLGPEASPERPPPAGPRSQAGALRFDLRPTEGGLAGGLTFRF